MQPSRSHPTMLGPSWRQLKLLQLTHKRGLSVKGGWLVPHRGRLGERQS
jgi:hypothetical protein